MKTKLVKIIVVVMAFAFFGTGVSMAQDRRGGRQNNVKANVHSHYKQDKNHKIVHKHPVKNYIVHKHYSKPYYCPKCRPVVVHQHYNQYSPYEPYPYYAGQFVAFSVINPNVAFSIAVGGH